MLIPRFVIVADMIINNLSLSSNNLKVRDGQVGEADVIEIVTNQILLFNI